MDDNLLFSYQMVIIKTKFSPTYNVYIVMTRELGLLKLQETVHDIFTLYLMISHLFPLHESVHRVMLKYVWQDNGFSYKSHS